MPIRMRRRFPLQVLIDNLERLAPFVYTPTVGQVCQRFGSYFRRARGMYFSAQDR